MSKELKNLMIKLTEVLQDMPESLQDLYEFSISRKKVKDKIEEYADDIMDHICKIIYLKHLVPDTVHHWYSEILWKVNLIIRRGIKGGSLKHKTLVEWLRNGLTKPSEMNARRNLVAIQENLTLDKLKPLDEQNDYSDIMQIISDIAHLAIECKDIVRQATIQDIENIMKDVR